MNTVFSVDYVSNDPKLTIEKFTNKELTPQFIGPHCPANQFIGPFSNFEVMKASFFGGKFVLKVIASYEDAFGRKFVTTISLDSVDGKTGECRILGVKVDGLEQLR